MPNPKPPSFHQRARAVLKPLRELCEREGFRYSECVEELNHVGEPQLAVGQLLIELEHRSEGKKIRRSPEAEAAFECIKGTPFDYTSDLW